MEHNFIKISDLPERPTQFRWGKWSFKDNLTLVHDDATYYEVDLERISTWEALDWIIQIGYKVWVTKEDLADFVYALDDIFSVQTQLNQKDPKELYDIGDEYLERSKNAN
jgi:hypothetical protein